MIDKDNQDKILAEYDANAHIYGILAPRLEQLLREILLGRGIQVHSITSRLKGRKSLAGKVAKNDASYECLADVTDLVGLRVTTYFAEDVDHVAAAIAEEFDIDPTNSVDKRRSLAADRFGYLSLHHVLSLKDSRCELTEYKAFKGLKVELQTRSILQHAWAEIEHDLGYKSEIEVPQHIRRRFALVAGLLELADREFGGIREELENYREGISSAVQENPADISLNLDSVRAFVSSSTIAKRLDEEIITVSNATPRNEEETASIFPIILKEMEVIGMKTIEQVALSLQTNQAVLSKFIKLWLADKPQDIISRHLALHYLFLLLVSDKGVTDACKLFEAAGLVGPEEIVNKLVSTAAQSRSNSEIEQ